uniref:CUB domain-containing protein n=1 Tax=Megaselia scalaris TaxID=36166 RepID=T1H3E3_MEGSC
MGPTKNLTCIDYIKVPENYTISLFTSNGFDIWNDKCRNNITIFDEKNKRKIVEKCNSEISENLPVFINSNFIRIERNIFLTQTLTYIASKEGLGCGGKLSLSKGSFSSPMFPENERAVQSCRWELSTSVGTVIRIDFARFEMGSTAYCQNNSVKFLEVQSNGEEKQVRSYCGGETPASYTSSGNKNPPNKKICIPQLTFGHSRMF